MRAGVIFAVTLFSFSILVSVPARAEVRTVTTFESASLYWTVVGGGSDARAHATFRRSGASKSETSLDLVYDADLDEYTGSLLNLKAGSTYTVTLHFNGAPVDTTTLRTWSDSFPVMRTVQVPTGRQATPLKIKGVHGSPSGYVLYQPALRSSPTLDGSDIANNIVIEDSSYVIVRGFKLVNAQQSAVQLRSSAPVHDIVIEANEITNWGRLNLPTGYADRGDAISTDDGLGTNFARLIVQRNRIHDPRAGANSWAQYRADMAGPSCSQGPPVRCHPKGARAVFVRDTGGNHVIRYNEITGSAGRYFEDALGSAVNDSILGGYGPDSDIYGNVITGVWDDAIETEGGNRNVRLWRNYFDQTNNAFGLAPVLEGPVYVFRNVLYRTRHSTIEGYQTGHFIKNDAPDRISGRIYILHNTVWAGPDGAGGTEIAVKGNCLANVFARNNILRATLAAYRSERCAEAASNDLDYDLYTAPLKNLAGAEGNGLQKEAVYAAPNSLSLAPGTAGLNDGVRLPNVSAAKPDRGAQESGALPLAFGLAAP